MVPAFVFCTVASLLLKLFFGVVLGQAVSERINFSAFVCVILS